MTAIYHSPFLIALGWTIAASLWQGALLWLIYQLVSNIFIKNNPAIKHAVAVLFLFGSFIWFGATFIQHYNEITGLTQSLTALSETNTATTQALLTLTKNSADTWIIDAINKYLPYFSTAYLMVLLVLLVKLGNAYMHSRKLRLEGLIEVDSYWQNLVNQYAKQIGIIKNVRIYFSEFIDVPATLDFFKPVILLPVAAFNHLSIQQVESILLHELAHIRRNDYLINIIASVIETILFFNPFVNLIAKSLKKEREHCCDDLVLQYKFDPHSYASALLSLEKMRIGFQPLAVAATGSNNQLLGRVKRIMNVKSTNFNYGQKLLALAVTAFILISIAWLTPPSNTNKEVANSQPAHVDKTSTIFKNVEITRSTEPSGNHFTIQQPGKRTSSTNITEVGTTTDDGEAPEETSELNADLQASVNNNGLTEPPAPPLPPVPTPASPLEYSAPYVPGDFQFESPSYVVPDGSYTIENAEDETIKERDLQFQWSMKQNDSKAYAEAFNKLQEMTRDVNPEETRKIVDLFFQLDKKNKDIKNAHADVLLQKNLNNLFESQSKLLKDKSLLLEKNFKRKMNADSIQMQNRLMFKKKEQEKAIWIKNDALNKLSELQNTLYVTNANQNADAALNTAITIAASPKVKILPKAAVTANINAVVPVIKTIARKAIAFTMDYPSSQASASISASNTKEETHCRKLVITNEQNGNTLVITIEQ
ncbi:MAG: M56 family metallopeptidase [Agriterribacter sp.]